MLQLPQTLPVLTKIEFCFQMFLHLLYVLTTVSEDIKWLFIFKFLPVLVVSWRNRSTEFFTPPFWEEKMIL